MIKFHKAHLEWPFYCVNEPQNSLYKHPGHDLANCPLFLKNGRQTPKIEILEKFIKVERDPPCWPFITINMAVLAFKKFHGENSLNIGTQQHFSKYPKMWSYAVCPRLSTRIDPKWSNSIKLPFIARITKKMAINSKNMTLWFAP